jgi:hypothetical protein
MFIIIIIIIIFFFHRQKTLPSCTTSCERKLSARKNENNNKDDVPIFQVSTSKIILKNRLLFTRQLSFNSIRSNTPATSCSSQHDYNSQVHTCTLSLQPAKPRPSLTSTTSNNNNNFALLRTGSPSNLRHQVYETRQISTPTNIHPMNITLNLPEPNLESNTKARTTTFSRRPLSWSPRFSICSNKNNNLLNTTWTTKSVNVNKINSNNGLYCIGSQIPLIHK